MSKKASLSSLKTPRALDPTFGNNGIIRFSKILNLNTVEASTQTKDGEYFCCGFLLDTNSSMFVIKLLSNGLFDPGFGNDGKQEFDPGELDRSGKAMSVIIGIIQIETRILVIGWTSLLENEELTVVAIKTNGQIESRFGKGGVKRVSIVTSIRKAGIVASKSFYHNPLIIPIPGAVVRLNRDGELDTSFNGTGILPIKDGLNQTIAVQPADNKILIADNHHTANDAVRIYRFTDAGILDKSFARDGIYTTPRPEHTISTLVADLNGVITYLGVRSETPQHHFLAQLLEDGTLDSSFNEGKPLPLKTLENSTYAYDGYFSIDNQNRRGIAMTGLLGGGNFAVVLRYLRNGLLDPTLGDEGMFVTTLGDARGIHVREQDKLVVVGYVHKEITGEAQGIV